MGKLTLMFFLLFSDFAIARSKMTFILQEVDSGQCVIAYLSNLFSNRIFNSFFNRKLIGQVKTLGLLLNNHIVKTYVNGFKEVTFKWECHTAELTAIDTNIKQPKQT